MLARVKSHLKVNKKVYLFGMGCLGVGYILGRQIVAPEMDGVNILHSMGESPQLTNEVLLGLAEGTFDEWDCDLATALGMFGPEEFAIAARSGSISLEYVKTKGE